MESKKQSFLLFVNVIQSSCMFLNWFIINNTWLYLIYLLFSIIMAGPKMVARRFLLAWCQSCDEEHSDAVGVVQLWAFAKNALDKSTFKWNVLSVKNCQGFVTALH